MIKNIQNINLRLILYISKQGLKKISLEIKEKKSLLVGRILSFFIVGELDVP